MELGSNWKQPHKSTASEIENGHDPTLSQSPRGLLVDIATRQKTLILRFSKEPFPVDRRLMVRIDRYSSYTSKTFLDAYHVYLLAKLQHSHSVTKRTCGKPSPGGPVDAVSSTRCRPIRWVWELNRWIWVQRWCPVKTLGQPFRMVPNKHKFGELRIWPVLCG